MYLNPGYRGKGKKKCAKSLEIGRYVWKYTAAEKLHVKPALRRPLSFRRQYHDGSFEVLRKTRYMEGDLLGRLVE